MPLLPENLAPKAIGELNPVFVIARGRHVMVTQAIASILRRDLKSAIGSLADQRDQITRGLDILLVGF